MPHIGRKSGTQIRDYLARRDDFLQFHSFGYHIVPHIEERKKKKNDAAKQRASTFFM